MRYCSLFCCIVLLVTIAPAQDKDNILGESFSLLKVLPARTLLVLGSPSVDAARQAFAKSHLRQLWEEPEVQRFVAPLMTKMHPHVEKIRRRFEQKMGMPLKQALSIASGEVVVAVVDVDPSDKKMPLTVAIHLQVGAHMKTALQLRDLALKMTQMPMQTMDFNGVTIYHAQGMPLFYAIVDSSFLFTSKKTLLEELVTNHQKGNEQDTLVNTADFKRIESRIFPEDEICAFGVYANLAGAFNIAGNMMPPHVYSMIEAVGVTDIRALAMGCSMQDDLHRHRFLLYAPDTTKGIHKLYRWGQADIAAAASQTPASALMFSVANFDMPAFLAVIEEIIDLVDPEGHAGLLNNYQGLLSMANEHLGFDIKEDFAAAFGTRAFASAVLPHNGGLLPDSVKVYPEVDKEKVEKLVTALVKGLQLERKSFAYGDYTIHYLLSPMGKLGENPFKKLERAGNPIMALHTIFGYGLSGMAFTYQDSRLYFSQSTHGLLDYLDWQNGNSPRLNTVDAFRKSIPTNSSLFLYINYSMVIERWYNTLRVLLRNFEGYIRAAGVPLESGLLPQSSTLAHHFGPGTLSFAATADGLLVSSSSHIGLLGPAVVVGGVGAGLALPALQKTKAKAHQAACKANLRQLAMSAILYEMNYGKQLPTEGIKFLTTLYNKKIASELDMFLCPATKDKNTPQDFAAHLPRASSYEAISVPFRKFRPVSQHGDTPIIWDKYGNHQGVRNVAFADGRVKTMSERRFQKLMQQLRDEYKQYLSQQEEETNDPAKDSGK